MSKHAAAAALAVLLVSTSALAQTEEESPEERAYDGRVDANVRSWIHEGNHAVTDEERQAIKEHWERSAELWRIRALAKSVNDEAIVSRVDALITKSDRILEERITRFRAHAPILNMAPSSIEVPQAPPPPQAEAQGPAPSPDQVWMPGFWQWNGARHVWSAGRWTPPPQPGMAWDAPRWENRSGRYAFIEGRWHPSVAPAPNVVYEPPPTPEVDVPVAPPQPIVEVRPPQPPNGVWIPGYWHWAGNRHAWVGGRWSAPKAGMRWQPDHWEHRGNQFHFVRGAWSR
jgi:hypothetical protein